jgi:hypothetical protein
VTPSAAKQADQQSEASSNPVGATPDRKKRIATT